MVDFNPIGHIVAASTDIGYVSAQEMRAFGFTDLKDNFPWITAEFHGELVVPGGGGPTNAVCATLLSMEGAATLVAAITVYFEAPERLKAGWLAALDRETMRVRKIMNLKPGDL